MGSDVGIQDIEIRQGDNFVGVFEFRQPDGTPVDLTGFAARAQMRRKVESPAPVAVFGVDILFPHTLGCIRLALTAPQTALISAGSYVYDVVVDGSGDVVDRLAEGAVVVLGTVYHKALRL